MFVSWWEQFKEQTRKLTDTKLKLPSWGKKKKSCNFLLIQLSELICSRETKMPAADTVVQQSYTAEVREQIRHRSRAQVSLLSTENHWHLFLSCAFFLTLLHSLSILSSSVWLTPGCFAFFFFQLFSVIASCKWCDLFSCQLLSPLVRSGIWKFERLFWMLKTAWA